MALDLRVLQAIFASRYHAHEELADLSVVTPINDRLETHDHDDDYYTKDEIDTLLAGLESGVLRPMFEVYKNAGQSIPATTWTKIIWNLLFESVRSPEMITGSSSYHKPGAANAGLWLYTFTIAAPGSPDGYLAIDKNGNHEALNRLSNGYGSVSWVSWTRENDEITFNIWLANAANLDTNRYNCHATGVKISDV